MTESKDSSHHQPTPVASTAATNAAATSVTLPPYAVSRRVLTQANVNDISEYDRGDTKLRSKLAAAVHDFSLLAFLLNAVPALRWVPAYRIRHDLLGDVIAGITVAVMHIPQGMAYGLLAGVTPSAGLYMAVFPTLVYFVFGTSRHISVGTLSVVSVMTLKLVQTYATAGSGETDGETYTANQVVTAAAFVCGLQMVLMSALQLGNLASLLSESLVNGFTTGAAVHVLASQLKDMFGVKIPRHKGYFQVINTVVDFCRQLPHTNLNTLAVTGTVIAFMVVMNELVKPRAAKLCRFPIPAELVAVCGGTLASHLLQLGSAPFAVHLVGDIPLGFPAPQLPPVRLMYELAIDAVAITIVSYSVTVSMAMILAKKQNYEVRPNQELLAMGLSNLVGGLFSCVPNGTSLSRSLIQEQTGGRTQFASVVSAGLITLILLWIAPVFEVLPRCVLSGIIAVALKGMYMQAAELRRFRRESTLNALTWLVTFTAVVLVDVDIGLVAGIVVSLVAVYIKGWRTAHCQLGRVAGTELYADLRTHAAARAVPGVCIFRHIGALNFAFAGSFKRALYEAVPVTTEALRRATQSNAAATESATPTKGTSNGNGAGADVEQQQALLATGTRTVVLDLGAVTHMDVAALKTCREIERDLSVLGVRLLLAAPNDRVFVAVQHAEWLGIGRFVVMATVHDAVLYATATGGVTQAVEQEELTTKASTS